MQRRTIAYVTHQELSSQRLHSMIRKGEIQYAGNVRLKIYGTLKCSSGKRMKKENRVFFKDKGTAEASGFRRCGHCLRGH
jgi:methylphosphotriester-DNA--protein-cysteine methyltransferase